MKLLSILCVLLLTVPGAYGQQADTSVCPPYTYNGRLPEPGFDYLIETDAYAFELESATGAQGDVVGVTLFFRSRLEQPGSLLCPQIAVCHDPAADELVGEPSYSDEFLAMVGTTGVFFLRVDESQNPESHKGYGFLLEIDLVPTEYDARFPSEIPLPIATVYYRLRGVPGASTTLTFCDAVLKRAPITCTYTRFRAHQSGAFWDYLSTVNVPGTLTVVEGPMTRPEPPPQPPKAKVYPALPSPEEADFRVRVTGGLAWPGRREVPVEVYVRANVEYSGVVVPVDFDERYLRLARAVDHFITGGVLVDNRDETPGAGPDEGHAVIYSGMGVGSRRLAAEGEEILAATLYFDVLETAWEIGETEVVVSQVTDARGIRFFPWIGVHYGTGTVATDPTVSRSEVEPILIASGVLKIRRTPTFLGDVNLDDALDVSDAIAILSHLYLGRTEVFCAEAADFNDDGSIDISDPISLLSYLFLGGPPGPMREVRCW